MSKIKIFIDAGHNPSGWNTGATGNGMREQDIVYEVAKHLEDILKSDFELKLSRPTKETILGTDNTTAINTRWQMANAWGADYFISIHANAGGGTGAETYYFRDDSLNYAKTIQDTYCTEMGLRNRRTEKRDNLAVLSNTNHPSILLELGFIDNTQDALILKTKRLEMAKAISKGLSKFLGVPINDNVDEEEEEMRYNKLEEIPEWAKSTIEKLINLQILNGTGEGLNLTEDMIRLLVINDRAGLYK